MSTEALLDAALDYASRDGPAPARPGRQDPDKRARREGRHKRPDRIRAWWTETPDANVGVATGSVSGITVLDVDRKLGKDGFVTLETLGIKPTGTPLQVTQSGGAQILFAYAPGVKNTVGKLGVGIDTRGDGGYVVVPPSRVNGRPYTWISEPFTGASLAEMPLELVKKVADRPGPKPPRPASEWADILKGVPEGRRQDELVKVVGKLIAEVRDRNLALTLAHEWASRCEPPLTSAEVETCFMQTSLRRRTRNLTRESARGRFVPLSTVAMKPVPWLWPGYLARGAVHLLVGDPDKGKTLAALDLAARITTGAAWPDGVTNAHGTGAVIVLSAEDSSSYTIRPRVEAAGGNSARVHVLSSESAEAGMSLSRDLEHIDAAIEATGATLVIIDPLSAYMPDIDTYRDNEVRRIGAPFVALAQRRAATVIGIVHMSKNVERNAMQRVLGSTAFTALSRGTFMVAQHPDDVDRRVFLSVKFNLGRKPAGLAFKPTGTTIQTPEGGTIHSVRAVWESESIDLHPDEVLRRLADVGSSKHATEAAIRELLANGPVLAKDAEARLGASEATLRRARTEARRGVDARPRGHDARPLLLAAAPLGRAGSRAVDQGSDGTPDVETRQGAKPYRDRASGRWRLDRRVLVVADPEK